MDPKYLQNIRSSLISCSYNRIDFDELVNILNGFENKLRKMKTNERNTFIENNLVILSAIKF